MVNGAVVAVGAKVGVLVKVMVGVGVQVGVFVGVKVGVCVFVGAVVGFVPVPENDKLSKLVSHPFVEPMVSVAHGVVNPVWIVASVLDATLWVFVVLPAQLIETVDAVPPPLNACKLVRVRV